MKFLLFPVFCIFFQTAHATEVKINIKAPDKSGSRDITFGYSAVKLYGNFEMMDSLISSASGVFDLDLEPGGYAFGFFHPAADHLIQYVFVGEEQVTIDVTLGTDKKPKQITSVGIYEGFNRQNPADAIPLEYDKASKSWKLSNDKIPANLQNYDITLNGTYRTQDLGTEITEPTVWGRYHNVYSGDEITFRVPDLKKIAPSVDTQDTSDDFNQYFNAYINLKRPLISIRSKAHTLIRQGKRYDTAQVSNGFDKFITGMEELLSQYPKYSAMTKEILAFHHFRMSPTSIASFYASKQGDRDLQQQIDNSEENLNQAALAGKYISTIDVADLSLTGDFITSLSRLTYYFSRHDLYESSNVDFGRFDYLFSQATKSTNRRVRATALFEKARSLSRTRKSKSMELLLQLQNEMPESIEVVSGRVASLMKNIEFGVGDVAPDFTLLSLDGEKVSLSDFKGKFVLLDFWGSWCAPCVQELPHLKKLDEDIADKSLEIIGIVCRESADKAQKAIDKFDLKYTNVIGTDAVQADYAINSYPSSFLVNPSGKIVAENLRGSTLSDMVRSYMKND